MSGAGQGSVRVFISYSTKDADLVQRLKDGLARTARRLAHAPILPTRA